MKWLQPITFSGFKCQLKPLAHHYRDELVGSVKDGEMWGLWYTLIPKPNEMKREIDRRFTLQAQGAMLPFVIINIATGDVAGMTSFLNANSSHRRLEIGGAWIRSSMQKTAINTEDKLLLLNHAFETLNCNAVEIRTHYFNHQSRRSIERLGAKLDGVLRHDMIMPDNTLRDARVYSILSKEWSSVKTNLVWWLKKIELIV